jgi:hypothetical protein
MKSKKKNEKRAESDETASFVTKVGEGTPSKRLKRLWKKEGSELSLRSFVAEIMSSPTASSQRADAEAWFSCKSYQGLSPRKKERRAARQMLPKKSSAGVKLSKKKSNESQGEGKKKR